MVASTVASQQEGLGFESAPAFSVQSLHVLPVQAWLFSSQSGFLPQFKDIFVRLIDQTKLTMSVNVVCLCVLALR